jgi:NDP-sugar pyrophosphorylase family protein
MKVVILCGGLGTRLREEMQMLKRPHVAELERINF